MKVLIVGNGGREHALLWKLSRDAPDAEFFTTGGNAGTAELATALPFAPREFQSIAGWAEAQDVDLTVVGPELPLAEGIVDHFSARGLPIFGPSRAAAEIESSKSFAKALMTRHGVPTARFEVFREPSAAVAYVRHLGGPLVVKASGLAAGKGAVVCQTTEEALVAVREMLVESSFGPAGAEVVVEEFMRGEELSVFVLSDGRHILPMLPSQDHKRVGEGETGANTGGMGAYAPVSIATPEMMARVEREVLEPIIGAMSEEERPFRGLLYAGLMLTDEGPKVVEFNCRFGDPETQAVLPLLESSLLEPMQAVARGDTLEGARLEWRAGAAVTTVLASGGYPGNYSTGVPIEIPDDVSHAEDLVTFHAGTTLRDGVQVTSGGRVLAVTALAPTVAEAAERSRWGAERIEFEGRYFRRDIGWREIERTS